MRHDRLVGVYDADGTIPGELAYLIGRTRGTGLPVAIAEEHRSGWEHCLPLLSAAVASGEERA